MENNLKLYLIRLDNLESFEDYQSWHELCFSTSIENALSYFLTLYQNKLSNIIIKSKMPKTDYKGNIYYDESIYLNDIEELNHNIKYIIKENIIEIKIKEGYIGEF